MNFDRLWEAAVRPAIDRAGYEPVRANEDIGALIITEMIERLAMVRRLERFSLVGTNGNCAGVYGSANTCSDSLLPRPFDAATTATYCLPFRPE